MIPRVATPLVRARLREFPAVALVGPRQSGKTTLAKSLARRYFDLEQPAERLRLDLEWDDLVSGRGLVVLDEAQAWPEVFPLARRDRYGTGEERAVPVAGVCFTELDEALE